MTIGIKETFNFTQKKIKEFKMKTRNIKFTAVFMILFLNSVIYSQNKSVRTYYPNDITINVSGSLLKSVSMESGETVISPSIMQMENVSKISFLNDSMISVSNDVRSDVLINIDKINQVIISKGANGGRIAGGAGIGALLGLGIGALIYGVSQKDDPEPGYGTNPFEGLEDLSMLPFMGIGFLTGALVGGITGAVIPNNETFNMDKYKDDRANQLVRILKTDKKRHNSSPQEYMYRK